MLNSRQRAQLRGMANHMDAIFQVGKGGTGAEMCAQIDKALEARELIKVSVLESCAAPVREVAGEISAATGADVVQVIGRKFVLYKPSRDHKTIVLVK